MTAENLLIEGDNLTVLTDDPPWRGHVDLILTDPPYNTGKTFRYPDHWPTSAAWLDFMTPRLVAMRDTLTPTGVFAICIDHRELFNLGQTLDQLYQPTNRLAIINWQKSYALHNDSRHVSTATEYVLVYAKDKHQAVTNLLPRTPKMDARYASPDGDHPWIRDSLSVGQGITHLQMVYAIQSPFTGQLHYPPAGGAWRLPQSTILTALRQWNVDYVLRDLHDHEHRTTIIGAPAPPGIKGVVIHGDPGLARQQAQAVLNTGPWPTVYFGHDGAGRPAHKRYLHDVKPGVTPTTWWADPTDSLSWDHHTAGHSRAGIDELSAVVGPHHHFKTAKPRKLLEKIIHLWSPPTGLVLDPFAGTGTTGHAVLALNHRADTARRFILIEQGTPTDPYARTLTADRLTRAITGDWANGPAEPLGGHFQLLTQDPQAAV